MNTAGDNMKNRGIAMFRNGGMFVRGIAAVIIIAFGGLVTSPAVAATRAEIEREPVMAAPGERASSAKLNETLLDVRTQLRTLAGKPDVLDHMTSKEERKAARDALKDLRPRLRELDKAVREDFRVIGKHLKERNLSDVILERHQDAVAHYESEAAALLNALAEIEFADEDKAAEQAVAALERLEKQQLRRTHQTLDPDEMPNRSRKADDRREPHVSPEQFITASVPMDLTRLLAANGNFDVSGLAGARDPAYLAPTTEVVLSDAIRAQAAALDHDPVKIYNWVRNNVQWQPTWGAVQDADLTLSAKRGNAFDIASLTIALLRASGIPARYVHGTIDVPEARFRNWMGGFEHINAAMDYAASGGIPVTSIVGNGVVTKIRIEHVWVEAAIDFNPSRGAVNRAADTWVPFDPSFKQYEILDGLDIADVAGFDSTSLASELLASGTVNAQEGWVTGVDLSILQNALSQAEAELGTYIEQNLPDATVGDVLGGRKILEENRALLSGALENRVVVAGERYAALPSTLRQYITFGFGADIFGGPAQSVHLPWPVLNNKRITLSFRPATASDESALHSLLPEDGINDVSELPASVPAYLINVVPELKVGDDVVMTGSSMRLGEELAFTFTPQFAEGSDAPNRYNVIAGSYLAIAVIAGNVSPSEIDLARQRVEATRAVLESEDAGQLAELARDDVYGNLFHAGLLGYYAQLMSQSYIAGMKRGGHHYLAAGVGSYGYEPEVDYFFGLPRAITPGGAVMNIPIVNVWGFDGDGSDAAKQERLDYILHAGMLSSALEHVVPEQMFDSPQSPTEGISAMKALQKASAAGQRVYTINAANQSAVLPLLNHSSLVMNEIRNALSAGKEVITHSTTVSVPGWSGAGYIIYDPETGDAAYKIGGGQNGGFAALLTGVAQGAAAMAMLLAVFAAVPGGIMAVFAALILVLFFLLPIFLVAVAYADSVFDSEQEQKCLGIGRFLGAALTSLLAAIHAGSIAEILKTLSGIGFIEIMFLNSSDGIGECV